MGVKVRQMGREAAGAAGAGAAGAAGAGAAGAAGARAAGTAAAGAGAAGAGAAAVSARVLLSVVLLLTTWALKTSTPAHSSRIKTTVFGGGATSCMSTAQLAIASVGGGAVAAVIRQDCAGDATRTQQQQDAVALPLRGLKKEKKIFSRFRWCCCLSCTESADSILSSCCSRQYQQQQQQPEDTQIFQPQRQGETQTSATRQQRQQHCRQLQQQQHQQPGKQPQQRRRLQRRRQRLLQQTLHPYTREQKKVGDECHREATWKKTHHHQHFTQVKQTLADISTACSRSTVGLGGLSNCCCFLEAGGGQRSIRRSSLLSKSEKTNVRRAVGAALRRVTAATVAALLRMRSACKTASSSSAATTTTTVIVTRAAATEDCTSWDHQSVRSVLAAITWWSACTRNKEHLVPPSSASRVPTPVVCSPLLSQNYLHQSRCLLSGAQITSQALLIRGYCKCVQQALRSAAVHRENLAVSSAGPAGAVAVPAGAVAAPAGAVAAPAGAVAAPAGVVAAPAVALTSALAAATVGFLPGRLAKPRGVAAAPVIRRCSSAGMTSFSRGGDLYNFPSGAVAGFSAGRVPAVVAEAVSLSLPVPVAVPAAAAAGGVCAVRGGRASVSAAAADSKHSCTQRSPGSSPPEEMRISSMGKVAAQQPVNAAAAAPKQRRTVCALKVPSHDVLADVSLPPKNRAAGDSSSFELRIAVTAGAAAAESLPAKVVAEDFSNTHGAEVDHTIYPLARVSIAAAAAEWKGTLRPEEAQSVCEDPQRLSLCSGCPPYDVVYCRRWVSGVTAEPPATETTTGGDEVATEFYGVGSLMMRAHHNRKRNKLGRPYGHRRCLLRNLCTQLLKYGSIVTTFAKAKECKRSMDKVLMLCKQPSLHTYRQALGFFYDKRLCRQLFIEAPERFAYRPHGFCRIEKLPFCRLGDNAEMARVELVD